MGTRRLGALALALLACAGGCSLLVSVDGLSDGEVDARDGGSTSADGSSLADGGVHADAEGGNGCPEGRGPRMVRISTGSSTFCIDSTEVTRTQYVAFLESTEPKITAPACEWNTSYVSGSTGGWTFKVEEGDLPATGIDWCDAYAFCRWAGKRLCGAIDGGTVSFADMRDPTRSQWHAACSRGGTRPFPFGQVSIPTACNTPAHDAGKLLPVGSLTACQGGYDGIFDMAGNAQEWEDNCSSPESGPAAPCELRGGSFFDDEGNSGCASSRGYGRGAGGKVVAARCCAP